MFVSNPFNYTASKDRLLSVIVDKFDYTKKTFVDLFCGSGVVGVNVADKYDLTVLNDGCKQMVELLQYLHDHDTEVILSRVYGYIKKFNLSKNNKEEFLTARNVYNNGKRDPMLLYTLITHAFSYQVVFNKSGGFSTPSGAGRSYFNQSLRKKLISYCETLHDSKRKFAFHSKVVGVDQIVVDGEKIDKCMFYCDPPYLTSDGSCSRSYGLRWTEKRDKALMDLLDSIHERGGSFAMSNALVNNGNCNEKLTEWAKKYNVHHLACDYENCHFQRKNLGRTDEVLITNY